MLTLKEYQQRTLDTLKQYFSVCSNLKDPDTAFYSLTKSPYSPVKELPGLPYVCLRIPTGGGKTLVAAHTVGLATNDFLQVDHSLVLWLTPSNAIREQTISALRDKNHPYRQALGTALKSVTIFDIQEALFMQPSVCEGSTVIIVATMQAFRVEDTDGRKVYEPSSILKNHFLNIPSNLLPYLETLSDNTPVPSLVNVFRLRNPIIIVDEAHNARTDLSFETLARFRPSCIIEFTATPATKNKPSNVLHAISAAELNAEEMIKLPIRLESREDWKELLSDALAVRRDLEKTALQEQNLTGEYIRPVMLLQAQPKRQNQETLTVDVVKACLIEDHKIPEEQIAIATGDTKELADVDISRPDCQIRFVITVSALREGWDCPFAYVLCSVAELRASTAVEQILGRIMRLPKAKRKKQLKLNQAYAFSASKNFVDAAKALEDALVENGFQRHEAQSFVTTVQYEFEEEPVVFMGSTSMKMSEKPALKELPKEVVGKVLFDEKKSVITFQGEMKESDKQALVKCFNTPEAKANVEKIYKASRGITVTPPLSPAERGEKFSVPVLTIKQGDLFEFFEETHFLDFPWKLATYDPALTEKDFASARSEGDVGTIDIDKEGAIKINYLNQIQTQLSFTGLDFAWSAETLILWLDKHIPHPDVIQPDAIGFLNGVLDHLLKTRNLQLENLVRDKYRLKAAIQEKIQQYRLAARTQAYQQLLLPKSPSPIEVRPEVCFSFKPDEYPYNTVFRGAYNFKKHFYPKVGDLNADGEEFECAVFLDTLPEIKFWVRNLERRQQHSFWLQTSSDKFYPDFVCALEDGRLLVVEYKGADRWSNDDSQEKRIIGQLWEDRSNGQCLFVMPKGKDLQAIKSKIAGGK
ncbi:MAG TPA: restriction endonuclease subunit R [Candidatus Riflebacteria bacterium]|jgi:type III restriction enzyme|nr:restriction endonuclease subunit R [Candidatus Riflebacteria bacterium]